MPHQRCGATTRDNHKATNRPQLAIPPNVTILPHLTGTRALSHERCGTLSAVRMLVPILGSRVLTDENSTDKLLGRG